MMALKITLAQLNNDIQSVWCLPPTFAVRTHSLFMLHAHVILYNVLDYSNQIHAHYVIFVDTG